MEDATNILPVESGEPATEDPALAAPSEPRPLAPELLAAVPAGPQITQEQLVEELAESRIRVLRIGGVALETIGTIAAAIFIEAAFFTAGYFLVITGAHWFGAPQSDGLARTYFSVDMIDDGGSGTGGAPKGTARTIGEPELAGDSPIAALGSRHSMASIPLPIPETSGNSSAPPASLLPDETPVIAFGSATSADAPKAKLPHPGVATAAPADGPRIDQANGPVAVASAAGGNSPHAAASTLGPGDGGGDDEYPTLDFVKPGKGGGVGSGTGRGSGNGTDRGPSFANHDQPAVLESPRIDLPEHIRRGFVPIKGGVVFEVTVEPDGKPSKIKLLKTCGNGEVDALMKSYVAATRFRPAYRAGHPITSTMDMSFFSDNDE